MGEYDTICRRIDRGEDPDIIGYCELCGEPYDLLNSRPSFSEVGEFATGQGTATVIAHGQCGIDNGLAMA